MKSKPVILHIKTGGTIGGCVPEYTEVEQVSGIFSDAVNFNKFIKHSFKTWAAYQEVEVCYKDSRELNGADREEILQIIKRQYSDGVKKFMITHGTWTMPETAIFLKENLSKDVLKSCKIVLTGSMYPWAVLGSDAPMNLGSALSSLINGKGSGVFLNMHGKDFLPEHVKKDTENLIFVEE